MDKIQVIKKYKIKPHNHLVLIEGKNVSNHVILLSDFNSYQIKEIIEPGGSFYLHKDQYLFLVEEDVVFKLTDSCNLIKVKEKVKIKFDKFKKEF